MDDLNRRFDTFPTSPFGAEIPDFDLGNELLGRLRSGNVTLAGARGTAERWRSEGRVALARAAGERFGMDELDFAILPNCPSASPKTASGLGDNRV